MGTVLVVGGGGREHTLAWCLARSPHVDRVLVAPGNAGTATEPGCENVDVAASDLDAIVELAIAEAVELVVVGPEDPLVAGLVDRCAAAGIAAFGPSAAAAQLEGSKAHCKQFLIAHDIPTGAASVFTDADEALAYLETLPEVPVIKASGLAAGKGVIVAEDRDEAATAIRSILVDGRFGSAGTEILLEERLHGPEVSVLAFCDGTDYVVMPPAQDHKRLGVGDTGPNTGGMGAFIPSPVVTGELLDQIARTVIEPTLSAMADEGRPYRGVLYAGMMITDRGPEVIEFNCRFGDPETQVVLPLLESDLFSIMRCCVDGSLATAEVRWSSDAAATVVMASQGYPVSSAEPVPIEGLDAAAASADTSVPSAADVKVFHAGTAQRDGVVHTAGGRVLAVTATADDLATAAAAAHAGVAAISFAGAQHRSDIARATAGDRATTGREVAR